MLLMACAPIITSKTQLPKKKSEEEETTIVYRKKDYV